jgi:diacylglycerol kinase family enzyme
MSRIGALVNRQAGSIRRNPEWVARMEALLPAGHLLTTATADDVAPALASLRDAGVETLLVCGGDGTVGGTLTTLLDGWPDPPTVVLAPGGTVNTIAKSLGADAGPVELLERLVSGRPLRHEAVRPLVRARTAEGLVRAGMIFVNGVGVRFLRMYYEDSSMGPRGAASVVARVVASSAVRGRLARETFASAPVRLHVDGRALELERFTVMAAGTVRDIGIGFRPFVFADRDPGRFHFAVTDASSARLVRELPALYRGRIREGSCVANYCAERVEMTFDAPEPWSFDADVHPPTHQLELAATPPLRFGVP